jgi:hypothetical protein
MLEGELPVTGIRTVGDDGELPHAGCVVEIDQAMRAFHRGISVGAKLGTAARGAT